MRHGKTFKSTVRSGLICLTAMALAGCGGIIPAGQGPAAGDRFQIGTGVDYPRAYRGSQSNVAQTGPSHNRSPSYTAPRYSPTVSNAPTSSRQSVPIASTPISRAVHPSDKTCMADLAQSGASFRPLPDSYGAKGCNAVGTVQLSSLSGDRSSIGVTNLGPVKCETAATFNAWAHYGVDRAARQILKSPLAKIETMGSYVCRNIAGTNKRSSHATANAIDVSAFVLKDGRRIVLKSEWDGGTAAEREFLRVVHKSACKRFGTVLGPEADAAHKDHFHLEGTGAKYCR